MIFTFNGKTNREFSLKVVNSNHLSTQPKVYESIKVAGRTGNVIIEDGSYENKNIEIECRLDLRKSENKKTIINNIKTWLQGVEGYSTLSFDDGMTFNAKYNGKIDIVEAFNNFYDALLVFEAYEVSSAKEKSALVVSDEAIYTNNSTDIIRPVLNVIGEGDCIVNINNQEVKIKGLEGHLTIDCFNMDCYKEEDNNIINCNNKMYGMFPKLEVGENKITVFGCEVEVIL